MRATPSTFTSATQLEVTDAWDISQNHETREVRAHAAAAAATLAPPTPSLTHGTAAASSLTSPLRTGRCARVSRWADAKVAPH